MHLQPIAAVSASAAGVRTRFKSLFGECAGIFRAPGRVNLIGEHTDYNDGFVMPAAIGFYTYVAVGPRSDRQVRVFSENYRERVEFDLDANPAGKTGSWSDYVRGVAGALESGGHRLRGADLVINGAVPIGAGLSSSASIEVAVALALLANSGITLEPLALALSCQQAEHHWAGTMCGIMDQFIATFGQANNALMLDCRTLKYELLNLNSKAQIVICNTKVSHSLASGEYNLRRQDCEAGVLHLKRFLPTIKALRDVTLADLDTHREGLPELTYRRCRHVISENDRVQTGADALKSGDLVKFGVLMAESHASLRDDYEVSCEELDLMVDIASGIGGVYGSRMTGGGFGGCTVNLVSGDCVGHFHDVIAREYEQATGIIPDVYICQASQGAGPAPEE